MRTRYVGGTKGEEKRSGYIHKGVDKFQCLGVLLALAVACCSFLANTSNVKLSQFTTSKANIWGTGALAPPSTHLSTAMILANQITVFA